MEGTAISLRKVIVLTVAAAVPTAALAPILLARSDDIPDLTSMVAGAVLVGSVVALWRGHVREAAVRTPGAVSAPAG